MNTLMLLKHFEKRVIVPLYFKGKDEAINWWGRLPAHDEWEIFYLEEREPRGHQYLPGRRWQMRRPRFFIF